MSTSPERLAAAEQITDLCARIDWNHVINGLDMRGIELLEQHQYGRHKANQQDIDAVQNLVSVLQEWGLQTWLDGGGAA